jgi:hypothetical protein
VKSVGVYMRTGWKEPQMFYQGYCKLHGRVVNYLHGYDQAFYCPVCDEQAFREETSKFTQKGEVSQ